MPSKPSLPNLPVVASAAPAPFDQDPQVKVARRAVRRSLERFERNVDRLAGKIETTGAVTVGWPILKNSFKAVRFVARNPMILAAGGAAVGGYWLYKKIKSPAQIRGPRRRARAGREKR